MKHLLDGLARPRKCRREQGHHAPRVPCSHAYTLRRIHYIGNLIHSIGLGGRHGVCPLLKRPTRRLAPVRKGGRGPAWGGRGGPRKEGEAGKDVARGTEAEDGGAGGGVSKGGGRLRP